MKKSVRQSSTKSTKRQAIEPQNSIIAERHLALEKGRRGNAIRVILRKPAKAADAKDYYCTVQILGLGDEKARPIYGLDSMQALQLALRFVSEYLNPYRGKLRWVGNKDIGF